MSALLVGNTCSLRAASLDGTSFAAFQGSIIRRAGPVAPRFEGFPMGLWGGSLVPCCFVYGM